MCWTAELYYSVTWLDFDTLAFLQLHTIYNTQTIHKICSWTVLVHVQQEDLNVRQAVLLTDVVLPDRTCPFCPLCLTSFTLCQSDRSIDRLPACMSVCMSDREEFRSVSVLIPVKLAQQILQKKINLITSADSPPAGFLLPCLSSLVSH